jgi:DNA-binding response OmpR family regulator
MAMTHSHRLLDKVFLIVEDEYLTASMLTTALEDAGARVIGPVSNAKAAFELLEREGADIDAAILDVNLNGVMDFSIADHLASISIPVVFATGYHWNSLPDRFAATLCFDKPYDERAIIEALSKL